MNKERFFIAASALVYIACACYGLNRVGFFYDELMFLNAALGAPAGELFITKRMLGLPLMVGEHIGAVKAWLWYPIFSIFGVSTATIRLPTVAIGAAALGLTYIYVRKLFNHRAALIAACLTAIDPAFIFSIRWDWAPTALMMLFKAAFFIGFCDWLSTGNRHSLIFAVAAGILGILDKPNFIWIPLAAASAATIMNARAVMASVRRHPRRALIGATFAIAAACQFLAFIRKFQNFGWVEPSQFPHRLGEISGMLAATFGGLGSYGMVFDYSAWRESAACLTLALATILAGWSCVIRGGLQKQEHGLSFMALFSLFMLLQIFITKAAWGPGHMVTLVPAWQILIAALTASSFEAKRPWVRWTAALSLAIAAVGSLHVDASYIRALHGTARNIYWDPASYELGHWIKGHPRRHTVCANWGLANVVLALAKDETTPYDLWPALLKDIPEESIRDIERRFLNADSLFLVYAPGVVDFNFPQTRKSFLNLAEKRGWELRKLGEIKDSAGRPFIELLGVDS